MAHSPHLSTCEPATLAASLVDAQIDAGDYDAGALMDALIDACIPKGIELDDATRENSPLLAPTLACVETALLSRLHSDRRDLARFQPSGDCPITHLLLSELVCSLHAHLIDTGLDRFLDD